MKRNRQSMVLKERESVFSRYKHPDGYPISSGEPQTHVHENNTKGT